VIGYCSLQWDAEAIEHAVDVLVEVHEDALLRDGDELCTQELLQVKLQLDHIVLTKVVNQLREGVWVTSGAGRAC
jgi:hypothetical protein